MLFYLVSYRLSPAHISHIIQHSFFCRVNAFLKLHPQRTTHHWRAFACSCYTIKTNSLLLAWRNAQNRFCLEGRQTRGAKTAIVKLRRRGAQRGAVTRRQVDAPYRFLVKRRAVSGTYPFAYSLIVNQPTFTPQKHSFQFRHHIPGNEYHLLSSHTRQAHNVFPSNPLKRSEGLGSYQRRPNNRYVQWTALRHTALHSLTSPSALSSIHKPCAPSASARFDAKILELRYFLKCFHILQKYSIFRLLSAVACGSVASSGKRR